MNNFLNKKIDLKIFIISISFLLITTYPYSPILYELFILNTQIAYIIYILIAIILIYNITKKNTFRKQVSQEKFLYIYIFTILLFSYLITNNNTALRDIYSLILILFIIIKTNKYQYLCIIRNYILILITLLTIAWLIKLLYLFNFINRLDWLLENIYISDGNPFVLRALNAEFEWSLLLNFTVLPFYSDYIYQRATLIFLEPTDLSAAVYPIIFLSIMDRDMPLRKFVIFLATISFIAAFSQWGYIVFIISTLLGILGLIFFKSIKFFLAFLTLLFLIITFNIADELIIYILALLAYNKLGEYETRLEHGFLNFQFLFTNYFGMPANELEQISSYGSEVIMYRYGLAGFIAFGMSIIFLIFYASRILLSRNNDHSFRLFGFIAIFGSVLIALKFPSILLLMPLTVSYYIYYIRNKI
jgi:hypothetical protein